MSARIDGPSASAEKVPTSATAATPRATEAKEAKEAKRVKEIREAAGSFEAVLLRQMLTSAHVGGKGSYSDMGVDSLADAITKGGGLGLGRAIEAAVAHHHPQMPAKAASTEGSTAPEKIVSRSVPNDRSSK